MVFTRRMAALAAVVLIPLGVAATSFAPADSPEPPEVPPQVELDSASPTPTATAPSMRPEPSDEVVSGPPVTDSPADDDDDDDGDRDSTDDGSDDDGPGDDG